MSPLDSALAELTGVPEAAISGGTYTVSAEATAAMSDLDKLLAEQAAKKASKKAATSSKGKKSGTAKKATKKK
jgi:hypothetical protein